MSVEKIPKDFLSSFFEIDKLRFERCLEPLMQCRGRPIRAHSVQNSRILDLLVRKGHVIGFRRRIDIEKGPVVDFGTVGRHEATTFTGLCADHDRDIFAPIDTKEFDVNDKEQLFLLAYRAVIRGLHATMEAAVKVQSGYKRRVALGLSPGDQPSPDGLFAVDRMILAWKTFRYRVDHFDTAFLDGSCDSIIHDVIIFNNQTPTVAASTLFSVGKLRNEDDLVGVVLNIVPRNESETVVIMSYAAKDATTARSEFSRVHNGQVDYQKYEISRTLLNYCENFVISPSYFKGWSDHKREVVREYFTRTIFENDTQFEDKDLMLF